MLEARTKAIDWWTKREIERALSRDLHSAQAALNLAHFKLNDAAKSIPNAVFPPDSSLFTRQALQEVKRAHAAHALALERWKNFVLHGVIPDDLVLPDTSRQP